MVMDAFSLLSFHSRFCYHCAWLHVEQRMGISFLVLYRHEKARPLVHTHSVNENGLG